MNKYVKQRQIGEGAFGKAILVRRKADNRNFVVKEINIMKMSPKERQESKKEVWFMIFNFKEDSNWEGHAPQMAHKIGKLLRPGAHYSTMSMFGFQIYLKILIHSTRIYVVRYSHILADRRYPTPHRKGGIRVGNFSIFTQSVAIHSPLTTVSPSSPVQVLNNLFDPNRAQVAVLAQLSHPNIVRYRESFEGDLYSKINSQRGMLFPEEQVLDWFVQICLAIKHIHDRKILHRDIKSQNIFLTGAGLVQLGDFGIAKVLGSTAELARTCIGTPYYLSPEIVENRPYNNKSDIWSLGCVLYELTTLKHAFEAGNMKNLVLKIIRGSYPPISPKYSYDLRGLIAALFKRSPRDRPSINSVLKKNFIVKRVSKFLSEEQIADEFSHTVMHGQKISRALPPPPPASRPPAPAAHKATPARKYDPSSVYGAPLKKSKDNRSSAEKKRPGSAGPSRPGSAQSRPGSARPGSAGGVKPSNSNQDLRKKRQALVEKEKKRQEEEKKAAAERKHKELVEKQRLARMNKAREEGWKNLMGSLGSDDGDPGDPANNGDRGVPGANGDRGKYDQYHAYLDKIQDQRNQRLRDEGQPKGGNQAAYMAAPRIANPPQPIPNWNRPGAKAPAPTPVYQAPTPGAQKPNGGKGGGGMGGQAEERARIVEDFIQRKREAAVNKQRGHVDIFGNVPRNVPGAQGGANQAPQMDGRNREEQEYLEKLRQIRQQNLQERKIVQQKQNNAEGAVEARKDAESRKKKIEALRQQAEDRAKQLRDQLDKQRREMFDKEKRMRLGEQQKYQPGQMNRAGKAVPRPLPPKPAVGMTGALNAIGAEAPKPPPPQGAPAIGITGVLGAIGAVSEPDKAELSESEKKSKEQQQKDETLRKLNEKMAKRPKWAAPGTPEIAESIESARQKWGDKGDLKLQDLPLEATASQMEVTSARDQVVKLGTLSEDNKEAVKSSKPSDEAEPVSARKQWGRPGSTVLRALQEAPVESGTMGSDKSEPLSARKQWGRPGSTVLRALQEAPVESGTIGSDKSDETTTPPSSSSETTPIPGVGSTITISSPKPSVQKGTIVIKPAAGKDEKDETDRENENKSSTSTISISNQQSDNKSNSEDQDIVANQVSDNISSKDEKDTDKKEVPDKSESSDNIDQSEGQKDSISQSKSNIAAKPPIPSKPVVLPKPVLLSKPDSPMKFAGPSIPSFMKSQGAGELFQKVEERLQQINAEKEKSEHESETTKKEEVKTEVKGDLEVKDSGSEKPSSKQNSGLILGLTAGQFDINNAQLLRTCSEPDLTKLVRTAEMQGLKASQPIRRSLDLEELKQEEDEMVQCLLANVDLEEDEEEEATEGQGQTPKNDGNHDNQSKEQEGGEEEEENIDEEDYEELLSVRETMQSLLLRECSNGEDVTDSKNESLKSSNEMANSSKEKEDMVDEDNKDDTKTEDDDEDDDDREDDENGDDDDENGDENEDDEEDEENEEDAQNEDDGEDDVDSPVKRSVSADDEDPSDSRSDLFQSDESDADTQFGDDEDNFDLFSRLEESRAELETELGCDKFLKVYKTVQALQEDEDENIEEGAKLVTKILGQEKEHLYPKIFQLVMADAAFTEGTEIPIFFPVFVTHCCEC
ncbi:hypothetical protein FSP39_016451 [Pinctada imbricata]|uniref:non-specific serine/threonine protein kinase n=1 Tax=Pinctada imbricata TaxID=66713 RepID=A0AA88YEN0_PINIB|nr:hypothetical protein FSP39_016451 [Pinctada imbricata]